MTLPAIAERISNLPSGGYLTENSKFDRHYLYSLIDSAAATVKRVEYNTTKKIHQSWYFPLNITVDISQQVNSGCYFKYEIPQIIALDARHMGLGFVGTIIANQGFRVTVGRAAFASQQADRYMKVRSSVTDILIDNGFIEMYGKLARKVLMSACWASVMDLPNYNLEKDHYPIEESQITAIEKVITQTELLIITKSFADRMANMNRTDDAPILQ